MCAIRGMCAPKFEFVCERKYKGNEKKFKQKEYTNAGNKTTEIQCEFTCCSNVYMCVKEVKILWLVRVVSQCLTMGHKGGLLLLS